MVLPTALALSLALLVPTRVPGWETHGPAYPLVDAIVTTENGAIFVGARQSPGGASALFRSVDRGRTWQLLAQAPRGQPIRQLTVDPTAPDRILALTLIDETLRVFRSDDGGLGWIHKSTFPGTTGGNAFFDPSRPDTAFLLTGNRLIRSAQGGLWTQTADTPAVLGAWVSPDGALFSIGQVVVCGRLICYPNSPRFYIDALFVSDDAGETASHSGDIPCTFNTVAYDPTSPMNAFGAGLACPALVRSGDGGRNWHEWNPSGDLERLLSNSPERKITQLLVDPLRPATLYGLAASSASEGEILWTRDSGQSWEVRPGPPGTSVTAIALDPSGDLIVGTSNGVFVRGNQTRLVLPRD